MLDTLTIKQKIMRGFIITTLPSLLIGIFAIQSLKQTTTALNKQSVQFDIYVIIAMIILSFGISIILGAVFSFFITKPIKDLEKMAIAVAEGNKIERSKIHTRDEIGKVASAFNWMANKLEQEKNNVEERVKERTADLEKLNEFMVGRELTMIELKKELKEVEERA